MAAASPARNWSPPLITTVSRQLLRPGRNVLHVRVEAVPEVRQGLTRVVLGQGGSARPLYELRYATQVTTFFMFGAAALLCALLAAGFWLRERSDTTLLWFAITAFAWAAAAFARGPSVTSGCSSAVSSPCCWWPWPR